MVVRGAAGERIAGARRSVTLRRTQPNGPHCPPVCFSNRLRFRADTGSLEPLGRR